uniref:DUF1985 domain-containing protein n=1 Tax=Cannabis sativa TaxID=3483 RepID=A0A803PTQ7_CANSA
MDESLQPAIMIIHSLLLHQRHTDNKTELELNFEDKKATFGLDEFALITGLNCSQLPKHVGDSNQPNMIKEKYFPGKHFVSRDNLKEFMLFGTIKDGDDAIKMAKVFTVTNILESKRGSTAVDEFIMKLVDDKEDFDKYPWGRRSFDETIKGLISAEECDKKGYELCGFPLAFQVWGFRSDSIARGIV